jgi:hypothetical protein
MGSFDQEVTNLTKGVEKEVGEIIEGEHIGETSMRTLTCLKWGRVTCPSMQNLKCVGSLGQGPSLDHHGVALTTI